MTEQPQVPPDREPSANGPVPDAWRTFDDTLADGPSPAEVPEDAKAWLGDQRFLHGMLRALHTADAAAREGRIASLLERIDEDEQVKASPRRHWGLVSAVALLLAAVMLWLTLPDRLPTADAAVSRAVAELSRDVNRRFRLQMVATDRTGKEQIRNEFALVTHPGMRFRIDGKLGFGGMQFGEIRIGCDGAELWVLPANGLFRRSVPLAERERLLKGFGDVLDIGYLDVHELVQRFPDEFELRVVGRESGRDGRPSVRIEATRRPGAKMPLVSAWLLCDEATGMVTRLEAEQDLRGGFGRHLSLEYLGEEAPALVDYRRPW
jgi:hypothetical protein